MCDCSDKLMCISPSEKAPQLNAIKNSAQIFATGSQKINTQNTILQ